MKIAIDFDGTVVNKDYSDEYLDKNSYLKFINHSINNNNTVHIVTARNINEKLFINKYTKIPIENIFCLNNVEEKINFINKNNYDVLIEDLDEVINNCKVKFKFNINKYDWSKLLFLFYTKKIFSPGPVPQDINININFSHRSEEYFNLHKNTVEKIKKVLNTNKNILFIQGSGTAAIECVVSSLKKNNKVVVFTNGTFGERLVEIFEHYFKFVLKVSNKQNLIEILKKEVPEVFAYVHFETSKSVYNDLTEILKYCEENNITTIADCVSSLGFYETPKVDVVCSSSAKILSGCPVMGLVIYNNENIFLDKGRGFYLDVKRYIINNKENQTPHTSLIPQLKTLYNNIDNRIKPEQIINNCLQFTTNKLEILNEKICPVLTFKGTKEQINELFKWFEFFNIQPYFNKIYMKDYFQISTFNYNSFELYKFINNIMEEVL